MKKILSGCEHCVVESGCARGFKKGLRADTKQKTVFCNPLGDSTVEPADYPYSCVCNWYGKEGRDWIIGEDGNTVLLKD